MRIESPPVEPTDEVDTGDLLAVPFGDQLDQDTYADNEINPDEFADLSDVPVGETYVVLETAHLDDPEDDGSQIKTGRDL